MGSRRAMRGEGRRRKRLNEAQEEEEKRGI